MASHADTLEQLLLQFQESEQSGQEAEQKAQASEPSRQEAGDEALGLAWPEALSVWHNVFSNPRINYRYGPSQSTHFTMATGRPYLAKWVHWTNFHQEHQSAFTQLSDQLGKPEVRAFESADFYKNGARRFMQNYKLVDEYSLVAFEQRTVEDMVVDAWQLMGGNLIGFESREGHALDVTSRLQWNARTELESPKMEGPKVTKLESKTSTAPDTTKHLFDKSCYIINEKGERRDLFVIEYMAADMLTPDMVLERMHDMSIDAIINPVKIPTDEDEKRKQEAEETIAIALTQTYDSMINLGLSYGYVNSGKTFIFLFLHPEELQTLFYEKIILDYPSTKSSIVPVAQPRLTAVGLVAGFAQMALSKAPWSEEDRINARNELSTWQHNGKILESTSPEIFSNKKSQDSLAFQEPDEHHTFPNTPPPQTHSRAKAKKNLALCQKDDIVFPLSRQDDDNASGRGGHTRLGDGESGLIQLSSKSNPNTTTESYRKRKRAASNSKDETKEGVNTLEEMCTEHKDNTAIPGQLYCTQACLLGLVRGHALDEQCPNLKAHQNRARYYSQNTTQGEFKGRRQRNNRHAIDQMGLVRLIEEQLQMPERNYDGGFKSLDRSDWTSALFRLELLSHGYTLVGKGTVEPLVPILEFEADMYKRMNSIQGKAIPVYLGSVNLESAFHLTTRTAIVRLMLLSWGGEEAWRCEIGPERLPLQRIRTYQEFSALGVNRGDTRPQNLLSNNELDRAILHDSEFAPGEEAEEKVSSTIAKTTKGKKNLLDLGSHKR